uniref:Uncharacterized protein n=1 Tax=Arundo donax TaxID=35708 RepID=A0A0A9GGS6_ARUDO
MNSSSASASASASASPSPCPAERYSPSAARSCGGISTAAGSAQDTPSDAGSSTRCS